MNAPFRDPHSGSNGAALWHPGKLWSLWDILELKAGAFLEAAPT